MTDKDKRPAAASDDTDTGTENAPIPATEGEAAKEETKEERRARRNAENDPRDHSGAVIEEPPTDVQQALSSARVDITNYNSPRTVKVPNPPPADGRRSLTSTERTKDVARDTNPAGGTDVTEEELAGDVDAQPPTGMPAGGQVPSDDPRPAREQAGMPPVTPRDSATPPKEKTRAQLAKEAAGEPPKAGTTRSADDASALAGETPTRDDKTKQKGK